MGLPDFRHHLLNGFGPRFSAHILDHVAELAAVGAAAAGLDVDVDVIVGVNKGPVRRRAVLQINIGLLVIDGFCLFPDPFLEKLGPGVFGLADEKIVSQIVA